MSEANNNPRAQLHDTLPPLLPVGHRVGTSIQLHVEVREMRDIPCP
jgi:hypothetical protein